MAGDEARGTGLYYFVAERGEASGAPGGPGGRRGSGRARGGATIEWSAREAVVGARGWWKSVLRLVDLFISGGFSGCVLIFFRILQPG